MRLPSTRRGERSHSSLLIRIYFPRTNCDPRLHTTPYHSSADREAEVYHRQVRPDQRIWREVVDALPGHWLDSAGQLVLRCCLAHWPGSRRPGGGVTPAAGNGSPEISKA